MSNKPNLEMIRAVLETTKSRLKEVLDNLEINDLDPQALAVHLTELEANLRRARVAA